MDPYLIYIALVLVVVILSVITFLFIMKKDNKQKSIIDVSMILALIDKDNVIDVKYIRNKIVLSFKDITIFNIEDLHSYGATGITVVGDKVKFYVDGSNEINERIYYSIKNYIEGK